MDTFIRRNSSLDRHIRQQNRKIKLWRWIKRILIALIFLFVGLVLFLKFDTSGAAVLTDNILRPLLGDSKVIYLEKIFFNSSDLVERLTNNSSSAVAPQFENQGSGQNLAGSRLDLDPLQVNKNFKSIHKLIRLGLFFFFSNYLIN